MNKENTMEPTLQQLIQKYPDLAPCQSDILAAYQLLASCYQQGGKTLICGNGGSAADSEHIVGELMKGFLSNRPLPPYLKKQLIEQFSDQGEYLATHLQGALSAISLVSQSALMTAFANDVASDISFAQQVYGYGQKGDVLIALSTSGNSKNIIHALQVANVMGLHTLGLTGQDGGEMKHFCDVIIRVPYQETLEVQERHLPIYHALCIMLEKEFFGP